MEYKDRQAFWRGPDELLGVGKEMALEPFNAVSMNKNIFY